MATLKIGTRVRYLGAPNDRFVAVGQVGTVVNAPSWTGSARVMWDDDTASVCPDALLQAIET